MIFIYYKCTCMNTNIHKYTNTQNCVRVCLCGNIYIQTYTFIPMNIYTQTYIHKGGSNPFTSIISFHHFLSEPPLPTETDPLPLSPPRPSRAPSTAAMLRQLAVISLVSIGKRDLAIYFFLY